MDIRQWTVRWVWVALLAVSSAVAEPVDLTGATVVAREADEVPATVLVEEVEKRTGLRWPVTGEWPEHGAVVAVVSGDAGRLGGVPVPDRLRIDKREGYTLATDTSSGRPVVWVVGADRAGALFGVGKLLRSLNWRQGSANLDGPLFVKTAPAYPIRGHQLGYRNRANSWDAWTVEQFDRHIRELALFGTNAIENIPFQDEDPAPHMKLSRRDMNRAMSEICDRYGLQYWVWTPADFDLSDEAKRSASLARHEELYRDCPRLDAVFFPGGDPGDNPTELVMPFLEDIARRLEKHHPDAKVWMSLQGFDDPDVDAFYEWIEAKRPDWFGGVVAGPSSPPIPETRSRLSRRYGLRHYPDITHNVRAQYPVPWIDPAFAFTLGREGINPRPVFYSYIHNNTAPYTDGFLTYSDGVHDDVNKIVWSALGWDPKTDLRDILVEYSRVFFGPDVAEAAADGIFGLERNFEGALAWNGGVDANLAFWQGLESRAPELRDNWRWQLCLLRAYYDAYIRHRLLNETALEEEANARMSEAPEVGVDAAIDAALAALRRADAEPVQPEWRTRIFELCDALFASIGLQTSVPRHQASGPERGAILDYVDYPLNNRWWLEDELEKVRRMATEEEKIARLVQLATWENPGPGSFYDDVGNVAKSPHVVRGEQINTAATPDSMPVPDFMFWESGMRRVRQSWFSKMDWPLGIRYQGLDPDADYVVRITGNKDCFVRANGTRLIPTIYGKELGDIKEYPVPRRLYRDGTILLTFDVPFEPGVNWREASWINEAWLIRK